jgi:hypothetical protein
METPQPVDERPVKRNQTSLIVAVVAIVFCCGCVLIAVAGYYGYNRIRSTRGIQEQPSEDAMPVVPDNTPSPTSELDSVFEDLGSDVILGEAPRGGLGNEVLRNDTWQYVGFAAIGLGCDQPLAAQSTIEVLQQPADGIWKEKWTVGCVSGDTYPFEVEFILVDSGATFNIKSMP